MYRTSRNLILLYAVFFSLFINKQTLAEEVVSSESSINQGGFIYDIQKVDPMLLAEDVEKLRSDLIRHQYELVKIVAQNELDAGDVIITVIMPGGLFYAGYRKHKLEQTKDTLLMVSDDISELSNDLADLQGHDTANPLILAQLP